MRSYETSPWAGEGASKTAPGTDTGRTMAMAVGSGGGGSRCGRRCGTEKRRVAVDSGGRMTPLARQSSPLRAGRGNFNVIFDWTMQVYIFCGAKVDILKHKRHPNECIRSIKTENLKSYSKTSTQRSMMLSRRSHNQMDHTTNPNVSTDIHSRSTR
jgi:hypothetical protein